MFGLYGAVSSKELSKIDLSIIDDLNLYVVLDIISDIINGVTKN